MMSAELLPDHSVVIPTRNHPDRLTTCLASILETTDAAWRYEVLVMDNSDSDLRPANARAVETCADARVRYVPMTDVGLMAARHQGVSAALGRVVSFVDDDELMLPSWFEGVRSCLRDPEVALVTGPLIPRYEAKPPSWLDHMWHTDRHCRRMGYLTLLDGGDTDRDIDPTLVWGGNLTVRKSVFEQVRGSHPDYLPVPWQAFQGDGEEGLTVKVGAAGYRARYSPACAVLHAVPADRMTLEYLGRRAWFVGLHNSFTQARREHGMGPDLGVPVAAVAARRSPASRVAGRAARVLRAGVMRARRPSAPPVLGETVAEEMWRQLSAARRDGYLWHRERLAALPGLRDYVCRPDFLDANASLPSDVAPV